MDKLIGTYQCVRCEEIWDGSELYIDPMSMRVRWTCGDLGCGANVVKLSDLPRNEYEKGLESKLDNSDG